MSLSNHAKIWLKTRYKTGLVSLRSNLKNEFSSVVDKLQSEDELAELLSAVDAHLEVKAKGQTALTPHQVNSFVLERCREENLIAEYEGRPKPFEVLS